MSSTPLRKRGDVLPLDAAAIRQIFGIAFAAAAPAAFAAGWVTFNVDDSASQVLTPVVALRWHDMLPRKESSSQLEGSLEVRVVLNTSPWVGRPARIYMLMPQVPQSTLSIDWRTDGRLLPGHLSGGQRQLVFQGVVPSARIEDTLHVRLAANPTDPVTPARVEYRFVIEVLTP